MIADTIAWFMLYYCSFETRLVRDMVSSETLDEFERKERVTKILKYSFLSLTTLCSVGFHVIVTIMILDYDLFQ